MSKFVYENLTISKYNHNTIVISENTSGVTIVIDPYQAPALASEKIVPDFIFISHDHYDHFSPKDISPILDKNTEIVVPSSIVNTCKTFLDVPEDSISPVVPLEENTFERKGIKIRVMSVPAYNLNKMTPQGKMYHPKEKEYVGYIIDINGTGVYYTGDTDKISEMDSLAGTVEIMLLPISGVYVMTLDEAIDAAKAVSPAVAIPMHYGSVVGSMDLGKQFKSHLQRVAPYIQVAVL